MPDWFIEQPAEPPCYGVMREAYADLDTCRNAGMGFGPIPWTAIREYAEFEDMDNDTTSLFIRLVRMMDAAVCAWHGGQAGRDNG